MSRSRGRTLVVRGRWVVPMTGPPIERGWVRIERGRVVGIGRRGSGADAIDVEDGLVLPGLVNAHTHLEFSGLETPLDPTGGLPAWIRRIVALRRGRTDDAADAVPRGLLESAAHGVTTVGEIATTLPAARPDGPRVRVFREAIGLSDHAVHRVAREVARDLDRLAARGGAVGVSPHAPYSVAAPLAARVIAAACRRGVPAAMHVAESLEEEELLASGGGPFRALLAELGAWPDGPPPRLLGPADWISRLARCSRAIIVHGTHLDHDPAAVARLARHRDRLAVAVCPRTNLALAGRLPPLATFREARVPVAIGTDGRGSAPDLSVLAECRTLVDAGACSPGEAVRMATVTGAWALRFESVAGILAPGRPADLVILRPRAPAAEAHAAAIAPDTAVVATLRNGRVIAGRLGD